MTLRAIHPYFVPPRAATLMMFDENDWILWREEIEDGKEKRKRQKTTLTTSLRCRKSELSALYISAERYGLDIIGREEIEDRLEATSDFYVNW